MRFPKLFAAATVASALIAGSASAGSDIHIGVKTNQNDAPVVVFIFSDDATSAFAPKDAFSIEIDDAGDCFADFDAPWDEFSENPGAPIYGPHSGRDLIEPSRLPTFFAGHTANILRETGLAPTPEAAIPYHNCAGKVWAQVLSKDPNE